jgi:beta-hydroxylase
MTWKRLKKNILAALGVAAALFLMPYFALAYIALGLIDVMRNERKTVELFDRYFFGNGFFTAWLFAPVNLLVDLFCFRNKRVYRPEDFSDDCRREIDEALAVFVARKDEIIARIDQELETERRGMFVYRWFGRQYNTELEELNKPFEHLRTIAVSVFDGRESTTSHFGPLRLTLRILYNLNPSQSADMFIECGNTKHYWRDDPLFIFDDTLIHRSVNENEGRRYCVFMDVMRPSPVPRFMLGLLRPLAAVSQQSRAIFYRRWKMLGMDEA